eukprot:4497701-Amphidinium_carterae.1
MRHASWVRSPALMISMSYSHPEPQSSSRRHSSRLTKALSHPSHPRPERSDIYHQIFFKEPPPELVQGSYADVSCAQKSPSFTYAFPSSPTSR